MMGSQASTGQHENVALLPNEPDRMAIGLATCAISAPIHDSGAAPRSPGVEATFIPELTNASDSNLQPFKVVRKFRFRI
jgi:hypothetical protein